MPEISTFKAKCATCGSCFSHPELGDFAYGQFILTGKSGSVHAYLDAIDNPVFELITGVIENASDSLVQEVTARLADPVGGQRLTMSHVCPKCGAGEWEIWHGEKVASEDVPAAAFSEFLSLSPEQQKRRVLEIRREVEALE